MRCYYVYMVRCSDGSYYVGVTNDYEARIAEHNDGVEPKSYTFKRRPVKLVYLSEFSEISQAISWEKHIKRWSRRKKETLIRGDFEGLPELAKNAKQRKILSIRTETQKRVMVSPVEP